MNKTILEKLFTILNILNIPYILIGGYAAAAWGYIRATKDTDFLACIPFEKIDKIIEDLKIQGFTVEYRLGDIEDPVKHMNLQGGKYVLQMFHRRPFFPLISSRHRFSSLLSIRLSSSSHIKNRSGGIFATLMKNRSTYNLNPNRIFRTLRDHESFLYDYFGRDHFFQGYEPGYISFSNR